MDISRILSNIKPVSPEAARAAQVHLDRLTKPPGSLGRLEEFARRLVALHGGEAPESLVKKVFVFAGDHGVSAEGVSAYPAEVTGQMVLNFLNGGAAINVLAKHGGAEVIVIDIGVARDFTGVEGLTGRKVLSPTGNIAAGPAMTRDEALRCIEVGVQTARENLPASPSLFAVGEMGIGNTTTAAAIASVVTGKPAAEVTGRGTGIDDQKLSRKIDVIEKAIALNAPDPGDPLDILAKVGGTEIGGIAGLCLGAAEKGVPVIIDGFISTAGALIAAGLERKVVDYLFPSHRSLEKGHTAMLEHLELKPVLDLDLRLGEGTGAVLAMHLVEGGLKIYREMATFEEAGVEKEIR